MLFLVKTCSKMLSGDKFSVILHQNLLGIFSALSVLLGNSLLTETWIRQPTLGLLLFTFDNTIVYLSAGSTFYSVLFKMIFRFVPLPDFVTGSLYSQLAD